MRKIILCCGLFLMVTCLSGCGCKRHGGFVKKEILFSPGSIKFASVVKQ